MQLAAVGIIIVAVSSTLAGAALAAPSTLYVDQSNPLCSDDGAGSQSEPFCSIGAAADEAVAGQTVVVKAGTYSENVTPRNSGTASAPIVYEADPAGSVTVRGRTHAFTLRAKSWITIRGFDVTATTGDGISVRNGSNLTITANRVSFAGQPSSGAVAKGIRLRGTTDSIVSDNQVDHNTDHGIQLTAGATRNQLIHNTVFANARGVERGAAGIDAYDSAGNTYGSNVSFDNEDSGIELRSGSNDSRVVNNATYRNGDHGIDVQDSSGARLVSNSVYANARIGINLEGDSSGALLANNISVNDALHSPTTSAEVRVDATSIAGTTMDYDIIFRRDAGVLVVWDSTSYSSLSALVAATGEESHGIEADPTWEAPDSGDLTLVEGSPAIDSATSAVGDELTEDAESNPRVDDPSTPNTGAGPRDYDDRGAYEFSGSMSFVDPLDRLARASRTPTPNPTTPTPSPTPTALPTAPAEPEPTPIPTPMSPSPKASPTPTATPVRPTPTAAPPTVTPVPPTPTAVQPTATSVPPTLTPTVPTASATATSSPRPTSTTAPPTATPPVAATPAGSVDEVHYTFFGPASVAFDWRGAARDIRYGRTTDYSAMAMAATPDPEPFSSPGPFQEVVLTDLEPGVTYHYSIGGGPDATFATAPSGSFRFDAIGDVGESHTYPNMGTTQAQIAADRPDFVLMIGDLTYAGAHEQAAVDRHYNDVMPWSRTAAYMPAWGNEEWEHATDDLRNYKGRFALPNAHTSPSAPAGGCCGEDWSWFDAGGVRFIAYPEPYDGSVWPEWHTGADPVFAAAQADPSIRFIVTFGHRPAYSTGHHPGSTQLAAILDAFGTKYSKYVLNLNAHSHDYERFHPINNVVHITSAGGGASLEAPWTTTDSRTAFRAMHLAHLRVDVSASEMHIEAVCGPPTSADDINCNQDEVIDSTTIVRPAP